jgi:hypothetical protein
MSRSPKHVSAKSRAKKPAVERPGVGLEKIVAQFQSLMGPGATALHDQRVVDRLGHERQVDVLIQGKFGGWPMTGVIECRDHSRKKDVTEIEAFAKKTEHLGAGLRLMVSKKGFTKKAIRLGKHEHIGCLTLLPDASHQFGFEIGEWWYGIISKWISLPLTVHFTDPNRMTNSFVYNEVIFDGKPVWNWFWKQFVTRLRDRTRLGHCVLNCPFDHPTELQIGGESYLVSGLSCAATGVFVKKRKWVTYTGQAFFDWHSGKVTIPPGATVETTPFAVDEIAKWEDYRGEIPRLEDTTDRKLCRTVALWTQSFDARMPVPDLEKLSPGEWNDNQVVEPLNPTEFDPNDAWVREVLANSAQSAAPPMESPLLSEVAPTFPGFRFTSPPQPQTN